MSVLKKLVPASVKKKIKNMILGSVDENTLASVIESVAGRKAAAIKDNNPKRFDGKLVVVTGANGFIGKCICKRMAQEGASVVACGRNEEKLVSLEQECLKEGVKISTCVMDVTNEESIKKAFESIDKFDIFINCAGGSARDNFSELKEQKDAIIKEIISVNLTGTVLCCKYAARHMSENKSGCIINLSSTIGVGGKSGFSEYAASKAGVIGFTRSLALELGKYNINVNCVTPGIVDRNLKEEKIASIIGTNALGSVGIDNDIAYAVSFLASDEAKFITGQNIIVDGGRSLGLKGD